MSSQQDNHWDSLASALSGEEANNENNASQDDKPNLTDNDEVDSTNEESVEPNQNQFGGDDPNQRAAIDENEPTEELNPSVESSQPSGIIEPLASAEDLVAENEAGNEPVEFATEESGFGVGLFNDEELSEIRAKNDKATQAKAEAVAVQQAHRDRKVEKDTPGDVSSPEKSQPKKQVSNLPSDAAEQDISVEDAKGVIENLESTGDDVIAALDRLFAPVEIGGDLEDTRQVEIVFESEEVDKSLDFDESRENEPDPIPTEAFSYSDLEGTPVDDAVVPEPDETEDEAELENEAELEAEQDVNEDKEAGVNPPPKSEKKRRRLKLRIWPWTRKRAEEDSEESFSDNKGQEPETKNGGGSVENEEVLEPEEPDEKKRSGNERRGKRRRKRSDAGKNINKGKEAGGLETGGSKGKESNDASRGDKASRGGGRRGRGRHDKRGSAESDQPRDLQETRESSADNADKPRRRRGNIPTWDTAVSYVVDKNVKARGKSIPKRERIKNKRRKSDSRDEERDREENVSNEKERGKRDSDNKGSKDKGNKGRGRNRRRRGKGNQRKDANREGNPGEQDSVKKSRDAGSKGDEREFGHDGTRKRRRKRSDGRREASKDASPNEPLEKKNEDLNGTVGEAKKPNRRRRRRRSRLDDAE